MGGVIDFGLVDEPVDDTTHVVAPHGEIDALTAPRLGSRLSAWPTRASAGVVVDLSEVTFMDSTGISVLLNALRHLATRHGELVLVCPTARILRPFEITGLVGCTSDLRSAREALGGLVATGAAPSRRRRDSRCSTARSARPDVSAGGGVSLSGCRWERWPSGVAGRSWRQRLRGGVVRRGLRSPVAGSAGDASSRHGQLRRAAGGRRPARRRRRSRPERRAARAKAAARPGTRGRVSARRRGAGGRSAGSRSGPSGRAARASTRRAAGSPPRRAGRWARAPAAAPRPRP